MRACVQVEARSAAVVVFIADRKKPVISLHALGKRARA